MSENSCVPCWCRVAVNSRDVLHELCQLARPRGDDVGQLGQTFEERRRAAGRHRLEILVRDRHGLHELLQVDALHDVGAGADRADDCLRLVRPALGDDRPGCHLTRPGGLEVEVLLPEGRQDLGRGGRPLAQSDAVLHGELDEHVRPAQAQAADGAHVHAGHADRVTLGQPGRVGEGGAVSRVVVDQRQLREIDRAKRDHDKQRTADDGDDDTVAFAEALHEQFAVCTLWLPTGPDGNVNGRPGWPVRTLRFTVPCTWMVRLQM